MLADQSEQSTWSEESSEPAAAPPTADAMAPAISTHAKVPTTRCGARRETTNDKNSVPVVPVRSDATPSDRLNLSTIIEEVNESMCSELTSER